MLCFNFAVYSDNLDVLVRGDRYDPEGLESPFPDPADALSLYNLTRSTSGSLYLTRWFLVTAKQSERKLRVENVYTRAWPRAIGLLAYDLKHFFTADNVDLPRMPDCVLAEGGVEPPFAAHTVSDRRDLPVAVLGYDKKLLAEPWAQASVHGPRSAKLFYLTKYDNGVYYPSPGICGKKNLVAAVVDWDRSRPRTKADFILRLEIPQA